MGPGDIYNFLATGEETNNSFFQFEAIVPTGGGPPPHIHSREDESFYMEKYFREGFPPVVDRNASPPPITEAQIQKLKKVAPKRVGVSGGPGGREEVRGHGSTHEVC